MATIRRPKGTKFFTMSRQLAQQRGLSFEARGLMAYLLSKPDGWSAELSDIEKEGDIGKDKRRRIIGELEKFGYLERHEIRIKGLIDYELTVHEIPLPENHRTSESHRPRTAQPCTGNPPTVKPSTVEPSSENLPVYNKENIEETEEEERERAGATAPAVLPPAEPTLAISDSRMPSRSKSSTTEKIPTARAPKICDEDYLNGLQVKECYAMLNVRMVYGKMVAWCEERGKQPTRARLLNWLNREDRPMVITSGTASYQPAAWQGGGR